MCGLKRNCGGLLLNSIIKKKEVVEESDNFNIGGSQGREDRVGQIMLYFLPIMLFLCAQNSTDYALNCAQKLPIILKLCSLFLEGANLYVQIITLLCYVHHNFITNLKPGLVAAIT